MSGLPDEVREERDRLLGWYAEAVAEIAEEGDVELAAGLHQAEQDVTGLASGLTDGSAGDLALGDEGADVVFGAIGGERDLGAARTRSSSCLRRCSRASSRSSVT